MNTWRTARRRITWAVWATACAAVPAAMAQEFHPARVELSFNRFYDFPAMVDALVRLEQAYPELLKLESIGKSYQGRDLWLMTINNPRTGSDREKPAMFIDANVHGNEVQGTEVCLYTIWYLMRHYGRVERITKLVDENVFYILPSTNPDGREFWLNEPNNPHTSRTGLVPTDNDNDGLYDEDGPEDLDGDGHITMMWKKDPNGRWRISNRDPRVFERVAADETGEYTMLGWEGIDNDGDGLVNEDGPGGYDMNRNWPSDWQPEHVQFGAGAYPFSYPETAAIGRFLYDRPNVAAVQSYHNSGGMILRGPGAQYRESWYPRRDVDVYDELGRTGEKILPYYRYWVIWKDLYTVHGGFVTWTWEGLGIYSFTNELWADPQYYYGKEGDWTDREVQRFKFGDLLQFEQLFTPITPYHHPQYGEILIGGWTKYSSRVPPTFMLEELCHRNFAFTMYHAAQMPRLSFGRIETKSLGGDVWQLTVEVKNGGAIPTISEHAANQKIGRKDFIEVQPKETGAATVVASGVLNEWYDTAMRLTKVNPARVWNEGGLWRNRPGMFRFVVQGAGVVEIAYESEKGGRIRQTVGPTGLP